MVAHQAEVGEVQRREVAAQRGRQDLRRRHRDAAPAQAASPPGRVPRRRSERGQQQPRLACGDAGRDQGHRRRRSRRQAQAPAHLRVQRVQRSLGAAVVRAPAQQRPEPVQVLVAHDAVGRVDEHPAALAEAPAEVHVLAEAEALTQSVELLVDGAAHEQVAGGHVQAVRPLALEEQTRAHVQRGRDLFVAVESRRAMVADGTPADRPHPLPGEVRRERPQPARVRDTVAVDEGEELSPRLLRPAVAREGGAAVAIIHQEACAARGGDLRHGPGVRRPVVHHDDVELFRRIVEVRERGEGSPRAPARGPG